MKHTWRVQPAPGGLAATGPIVDAMLVAPRHVAAHEPVGVRMMIDTGASSSCVAESLLIAAGHKPIRTTAIIGVSGRAEEYPVYRVGIQLGLDDPATSTAVLVTLEAPVIGMPVALLGIDGLIGRNFLRHAVFTYAGPAGEFELDFGAADRGAQPGTPAARKSAAQPRRKPKKPRSRRR